MGVELALYRGQDAIAGWFNMPAMNNSFFALVGNGAKLNGRKLTIPYQEFDENSYIGASSDSHKWKIPFSGKLRVYGSSGYQVLCVATGDLVAAFSTRFRFRDIAASAIILNEAGGQLTYYPSGEVVGLSDMLDVESCKEIIASHPKTAKEFIEMGFHKDNEEKSL